MKQYNDQLEELLLHKSYADLQPAEQEWVDELLGSKEAYASARAMRIRSAEILKAEIAPGDPNGLAGVMSRVQPRRSKGIPLWQAAAAILLAVLGTWMVMGLTQDRKSSIDRLLAKSDTIWQEIRVVDTVYLPAPQAENHPVAQTFPSAPKVEFRGEPLDLSHGSAAKLAAAIASFPDPKTMGNSAGAAPQNFPEIVQTDSDGLLSRR